MSGEMSGRLQDPGLKVLHELSERLRIEAEWSQWDDRAFVWWPAWFEQRISATPPLASDDRDTSRVEIVSALAHVPRASWDETSKSLEGLGRQLGLSRFVWLDGQLRLYSAIMVDETSHEAFGDLLEMAAMEQAELASNFGSRFPPLAGMLATSRNRPDVAVAVNRITDIARRPTISAWLADTSTEYWRVLESCEAAVFGKQRSLTARFGRPAVDGDDPWHGARDYLLVTDQLTHPRLGMGLELVLKMGRPVLVSGKSLGPAQLNQMESGQERPGLLLGTWGRQDGVDLPEFRMFVPSTLADPALLEELLRDMALRRSWIRDQGDDAAAYREEGAPGRRLSPFLAVDDDGQVDFGAEVEEAEEDEDASEGQDWSDLEPHLDSDEKIFRGLVRDGETLFCDLRPVEPELVPYLLDLGRTIDARWRPGTTATPRLHSWFRLQSFEINVGDFIWKVKSAGVSRDALAELQRLNMRGLGIAKEVNALATDSEDRIVTEGGYLVNVLALNLGATALVLMGLPTPPVTVGLTKGTIVDVPQFKDRQAEGDYWSDRTLESHSALKRLLETVMP